MIASAVPDLAAQGQPVVQPPQQEARRYFTQGGTWEFGGSAGFSSTTPVTAGATGDARTMVSATPAAGYFVMNGVEVVVNPLMAVYSSQGSVNSLDLLVMGGVGYAYRAHPRFFPFIEGVAGFGYSRSEAGTTVTRQGFAWGGRGGVKISVASGALLNLGAQYLQVTLNRSGESDRNGYNAISALVGLSFWL
jgi:hypothetical protein